MHYVHAKTLLSAQNGMNLYRGCTHGCIYCDSRSVCYHMEHAFEDIEVKQNAMVLLEDALRRKRKKCMIGTGSMSDSYLPLEMELGLYPPGAAADLRLRLRRCHSDQIRPYSSRSGTAAEDQPPGQGRGADHSDHVGRPALPHPRTQRLPHQRPAGGAAGSSSRQACPRWCGCALFCPF